MDWKYQTLAAVLFADSGGVAGSSERQGIKQADCRRSYDGPFIWPFGTPGMGCVLFSQEHIGSCHSFLSFISNACPWGRRYQIIFHDRRNTYIGRTVQLYGLQRFVCVRRSGFCLCGRPAEENAAFLGGRLFVLLSEKQEGRAVPAAKRRAGGTVCVCRMHFIRDGGSAVLSYCMVSAQITEVYGWFS